MATGVGLGLFQVIFIFLIGGGVFCTLSLYLGHFISRHIWGWQRFLGGLKQIILGVILLAIIGLLEVLYNIHYRGGRGMFLLGGGGGLFYLEPNELSFIFIGLIGMLYPVIIIIMDLEYAVRYYKYLVFMLWLFIVIFIFIFTGDILIFYVVYEFMVGLVFFLMYLTANTRGGVEAALFFIGWAIIGSILVGAGVIYLISVTQIRFFSALAKFNFTPDERYYLSLLFFFGFGTKLSIWPFWYWLPRAHVEVSTGMSIFLSCILIKVCFYGLMRIFWIIGGGEIIIPLIFFVCVSVFDLTLRLASQVDLKAITAYGSVLHVNLLVLLFLLDSNFPSGGLIYYVWGHSFATAGVFYVINLIERCFGSRSTFELSGIYAANPLVGILALGALVTFLEFPLSFFFWGEVWLWILVLDNFPVVGIFIMFMCVVLYMTIFFRLWWGLIFGAISNLAAYPKTAVSWEELFLAIYLLGFQYFIGFQPGILNWFCVCWGWVLLIYNWGYSEFKRGGFGGGICFGDAWVVLAY